MVIDKLTPRGGETGGGGGGECEWGVTTSLGEGRTWPVGLLVSKIIAVKGEVVLMVWVASGRGVVVLEPPLGSREIADVGDSTAFQSRSRMGRWWVLLSPWDALLASNFSDGSVGQG